MWKSDFLVWFMCSAGLAAFSCAVVDKQATKVLPQIVDTRVTPKETIITLDKISEGYEIILVVVDKDKADLLPFTPGEIAKRIFCNNEKDFPLENVIVVPEDDPALGSFAKQFTHQSRGAMVKSEIIDTDTHIVRVTVAGKKHDAYIRVLLARRKVKRMIKDTAY